MVEKIETGEVGSALRRHVLLCKRRLFLDTITPWLVTTSPSFGLVVLSSPLHMRNNYLNESTATYPVARVLGFQYASPACRVGSLRLVYKKRYAFAQSLDH